jgi:hypothetical protein
MSHTDPKTPTETAQKTLDPGKRKFLKAFAAGAGFAAPFVASFSMKDASNYVVHAQGGSNLAFLR